MSKISKQIPCSLSLSITSFCVKTNFKLTASMQLCQDTTYSRKLADRFCATKIKFTKEKVAAWCDTKTDMCIHNSMRVSFRAEVIDFFSSLLILCTKYIDLVYRERVFVLTWRSCKYVFRRDWISCFESKTCGRLFSVTSLP